MPFSAYDWWSMLCVVSVLNLAAWGWAAVLPAAWCLAGVAYVAFMFLVDVPMYRSRWLADEASGRHYLSVAQGWLDVSARWVVATRWEQWRSEVAWMSLYFSVAVWLSIALVHVPVPARRHTVATRRR